MNDSDFLYVLHHFLFLLKVGQQGFPALRRFLSSQHLVFVMPIKREETLCALVYIQHMGSQVKTACTFFTTMQGNLRLLSTFVAQPGIQLSQKLRNRQS